MQIGWQKPMQTQKQFISRQAQGTHRCKHKRQTLSEHRNENTKAGNNSNTQFQPEQSQDTRACKIGNCTHAKTHTHNIATLQAQRCKPTNICNMHKSHSQCPGHSTGHNTMPRPGPSPEPSTGHRPWPTTGHSTEHNPKHNT